MKKTIWMVLICVLVAISTASLAESNPNECAGINDKDARLVCYDNIFRFAPQQDNQSNSSLAPASPIDSRVQQEHASLSNWFSITPHRPNYILPVSYNFSSNYSTYGGIGELFNDTEVKFQLSLKTMLLPNMWRGSSFWAAYTQQSFWQLYADEKASSPFRETNYEPEIFWQLPVSFSLLGMDARVATFAFNHQSNGRAEPLSRSWNRLTGQLVLEKGRFVTSVQSWIRVGGSSNDDNPDIEDFMGRIRVGVAYKGDVHTIALGLKNNLSSDNRSGVELNWTFPLTQKIKGIVQGYSGYGENLIDMENYSNRLSVGLALTDWL